MKLDFNIVKDFKFSCNSHPLNEPPLAWPRLIKEFEHQGKQYRIRPIDTDDIETLLEIYRNYYPHLFQSQRHYFLEKSFYENEVSLLSRWEEDRYKKHFFVGVIEMLPQKEIIFGFACRKDPYDRVIQNLALVLKPEYRGYFLSNEYIRYLDELWERSGVDFVYGEVDSKEVMAQKLVLKIGAKVGGIMPGCFRYTFDGENYVRDMLIYMYKFYRGSEKYSTSPAEWNFADETKKQLEEISSL